MNTEFSHLCHLFIKIMHVLFLIAKRQIKEVLAMVLLVLLTMATINGLYVHATETHPLLLIVAACEFQQYLNWV